MVRVGVRDGKEAEPREGGKALVKKADEGWNTVTIRKAVSTTAIVPSGNSRRLRIRHSVVRWHMDTRRLDMIWVSSGSRAVSFVFLPNLPSSEPVLKSFP